MGTIELTSLLLTAQERRLVAACIAAAMAGAEDHEVRDLAGLWSRVHPDGEV